MGKPYIIFLIVILAMGNICGQNQKQPFVEVNFGLSQHGTGDLPGFIYGFSYGQEFTSRFYWQLGFEGSTNDKKDFSLTGVDPNGEEFDSTLHKVISGFQVTAGVKYNLIQIMNHQLGFSLLPLFRYQASNVTGSNIILFPAFTELPYPVRLYVNDEPNRTTAVGVALRINYQYHFDSTFFLGFMGGFQTDTNGDTIYYGSLKFGKAF